MFDGFFVDKYEPSYYFANFFFFCFEMNQTGVLHQQFTLGYILQCCVKMIKQSYRREIKLAILLVIHGFIQVLRY